MGRLRSVVRARVILAATSSPTMAIVSRGLLGRESLVGTARMEDVVRVALTDDHVHVWVERGQPGGDVPLDGASVRQLVGAGTTHVQVLVTLHRVARHLHDTVSCVEYARRTLRWHLTGFTSLR